MSFGSGRWARGGGVKEKMTKVGVLCERVHCCELANRKRVSG